MRYEEFLDAKTQLGGDHGFEPVWMLEALFPFQRDIVAWALRKGRAAIFADCGLGKTPMQLTWARNVCLKTGGRVLVVTPLAVGHQTVREGEKFGIECRRSQDGRPAGDITVTNYERLHLFTAGDYAGVVCDESGILKHFDGVRRAQITEFMRTRPYRLCCTATPAPNDYVELGTTAEALGAMGFMDMLSRFFRNDQNTTDTRRRWITTGGGSPKWRFKRHAQRPFWRWVASWSRALRRPSDLGYEDDGFVLPPLVEREIPVGVERPFDGELFVRAAIGLQEQRQERRMTLARRCEAAASRVVGEPHPVVTWCHLNDEGDLLERLIPGAVQVSGHDEDDRKEEIFRAFEDGSVRVLVTKPKIGGFGLNWQHCAHVTWFPTHSYEQYYQAVRRCWRFGQTRPVVVDVVTTEGERGVLQNLRRKAAAADAMFSELVAHMNDPLLFRTTAAGEEPRRPTWLS